MSTAEKIIRMLENRSGFDHWWDGIDEDIQQEILSEVDDIVFESHGDYIRYEERVCGPR